MKKINYIFTVLTFSIVAYSLQSCKDDRNTNSNAITSSKDVAVNISQEKDITQYSENIYNSNNGEFSDGEYIHKALSRKSLMNADLKDQPDTITHSEEIPISRSEIVKQLIYTNGGFFYQSVDNTNPDMKLIETLNVNKQPENEKVVKTEIKDNVVNLYNSSGTLIKSQTISNMNFKSTLDSLKLYLASQQNTQSQSQQIKRSLTLQNVVAHGMKVVGQNADEIIIEKDMDNQQSMLPYRVKTMVTRKAVMSFTSDMKRMNYQKIYENGQLINHLTYGYADNKDDNFKNGVTGFSSDLLPNANVKQMVNKKLSFRTDGTPYVQYNVEIYRKNIVTYNLK